MTQCPYCQMIEEKDQHIIIYEDEHTLAILNPMPASLGHILVLPKQHHTILEQLHDPLAGHLLIVASKLSAVLFDVLGGGTNVLVNNGAGAGQTIPHVAIHIIPRQDGDNIQLTWQPKDISQEELAEVESEILAQPGEETVTTISEEDARLKHLDRVP